MSAHLCIVNDEVAIWIDQEVICIRAATNCGDPAELSIDEAETLLGKLSEYVSFVKRNE